MKRPVFPINHRAAASLFRAREDHGLCAQGSTKRCCRRLRRWALHGFDETFHLPLPPKQTAPCQTSNTVWNEKQVIVPHSEVVGNLWAIHCPNNMEEGWTRCPTTGLAEKGPGARFTLIYIIHTCPPFWAFLQVMTTLAALSMDAAHGM